MKELHSCQLCPRLAAFRSEQKTRFPDYHCLPVGAFGDADANLLIVGLAPGLHGANASGRPFTGDASGQLLFEYLYRYGFANQARSSHAEDGLRLQNCRITNAVKCVPPNNRPIGEEIRSCNPYLRAEIAELHPGSVILALGQLAHRSVLRALELTQSESAFAHCAVHGLPGDLILVDSYHCSRYNFNTRRLTPAMFAKVFERIVGLMR